MINFIDILHMRMFEQLYLQQLHPVLWQGGRQNALARTAISAIVAQKYSSNACIVAMRKLYVIE